jgi:DNA-directed RNA polymerase subunit L
VQVQTNGKKTPIQTMQSALQDLGDEVQDIRSKFQRELEIEQGRHQGPQY